MYRECIKSRFCLSKIYVKTAAIKVCTHLLPVDLFSFEWTTHICSILQARIKPNSREIHAQLII